MMVPVQLAQAVQQFSVWVLPLVLSITLHEAAHGLAAHRLGDDTALRFGRVSANPLRHVDPFGTLVLPALLLLSGAPFLFGWAKPVPVNFRKLRPPRLGMVLVALAGPGINLLLALISALLLHATAYLPGWFEAWAESNLVNSVMINLVLAVFNLIPLPPLDGGRVAVAVLPAPLARPLARMERFTILGLMAALFLLPLIGVDLFYWIVEVPVHFLAITLYAATGLI